MNFNFRFGNLELRGEHLFINPKVEHDRAKIVKWGDTLKITVECPDCCNLNNYFVHPQSKLEVVRTCYECGAVLPFNCEAEKEVE